MAMEEADTLTATAVTVSAGEMEAAFSGPAVFANKMILTLTTTTARLSFIEVHPEGATPPALRAAVSMSVTELVAVRDLLNSLLTDDKLTIVTAGGGSNAQ